jgi:hypothetical protein
LIHLPLVFKMSTLEKILFIPGSYDEDKDKALELIRFWRGAMIKSFYEVDFHDPRRIEGNAQTIGELYLREYGTCYL